MPIIAILLMVLHLIKPIGIVGLRQRRDFWKIALYMIAAVLAVAALHQVWQVSVR